MVGSDGGGGVGSGGGCSCGGLVQMGNQIKGGRGAEGQTLGGLKWSTGTNVGGGGSSTESFCNLSLDFEMEQARPFTCFAKFPHHSLDKC